MLTGLEAHTHLSSRFVSVWQEATASIDSRAGFGNPARAMTPIGESLDRSTEISPHEISDEERPTGWNVSPLHAPRPSGGAMSPARGDASTAREALTPVGRRQPAGPELLAGFGTIEARSGAQPLAALMPVATTQAPIDPPALHPQGIPLSSTVSNTVAMTAAVQGLPPSPPQVSDAGQSTHEILTLVGGGMASGGGWVGSGNPMQVFTAIGQPLGGSMANSAVSVLGGLIAFGRSPSPATRLITVEGAADEPIASAFVNRIQAQVERATFRATGVRLIEGSNTITISASDLAGNSTTTTITVSFDARPPARPTVAATPPVTTATTHTLTGTKTPGSSIWVNGVEVVPLGDATTWTATVSLVEGENVLVIVSKDAAGNPSTSATATVTVDNLPPVVTFQPPAKTNFNPLLLRGSVDDRQTLVTINGVSAARAGRAFELSLPLTPGANALHLVATSPNGHVTEADYTVRLGTMPTIHAVQPADATKLYVGAPSTILTSATDQDEDPMQYQARLDGVALSEWSLNPSQSWIPGADHIGRHTLTVAVRDDDGGSSAQDVEVFVVRAPIQHP
ncbi:MAG: hypothetical protein HYY58_02820 [Candidatus Omnitrophica bacterium]|nr:hypothetical protein [Candidatus Omnitrophota bacterium]